MSRSKANKTSVSGSIPVTGSVLFTGTGGAVMLTGGGAGSVGITTVSSSTSSRPRWMKPDPRQPDTLGWRAWVWDPVDELLRSPHQGSLWLVSQFCADTWSDEGAVRGTVGLHARLVPKHWKIIGWPDCDGSSGLDENPLLVTGIVERFGRYVLGTEGWRSEQVAIHELMAPSTEIGLKLEQKYPDVIVHYPDQTEEEMPCKSEKSLELERGSRSLLPSSQPSPPQSQPWHQTTMAPQFATNASLQTATILQIASQSTLTQQALIAQIQASTGLTAAQKQAQAQLATNTLATPQSVSAPTPRPKPEKPWGAGDMFLMIVGAMIVSGWAGIATARWLHGG